ncbi:MAG: PAS domain-containing protein [Pontixanthobacter sp.]
MKNAANHACGEQNETQLPEVPGDISKSTLQNLPFSLVISDARVEDQPIAYVNKAFERVTGYSRERVLGENCRFLQGEDTDAADPRIIREALANEKEVTVDILNYRSDGTEFVNRLMITPLETEDGEVTHFMGIQSEIPEDIDFANRAARLDESLREVQHRVKNHLSMLLSLIRLEAKQANDVQASLEVLANRVEALNLLYDEFSSGKRQGATQTIGLGAYISRVASALNMLDGQRDVIVNINTESLDAEINAASHVGLLVSELLTNALQHAFEDGEKGRVEVNLRVEEDGNSLHLEVADDGRGLPEGSKWPEKGNLGSRIVRDLTRRLSAELSVESSGKGTIVVLTIPRSSIQSEPTGQ